MIQIKKFIFLLGRLYIKQGKRYVAYTYVLSVLYVCKKFKNKIEWKKIV